MRPFGQSKPHREAGSRGIRDDLGQFLAVPQHPDVRPRPVGPGGAEHRDRPGTHGRVDSRAVRDAFRTQLIDPVHMDLADLGSTGGRRRGPHTRGRGDQDVALADVQHRPDVQLPAGQGPVADGQDPRPALVGDPYEPPVGRPGRDARQEFQPVRVLVDMHGAGRARRGVDGQVELGALVPGLHEQQRRPVRGPVDPGEIGVAGPVPDDLGAGPVQRVQEEPHLGVGRARRRIGDPHGLLAGVGRVRDPPAPHGRVVRAGDQEAVRAGAPPVAARAGHLLRGDELGEPVRHFGRLGLGERPVVVALGPHDPQRAPRHIGHVAPVGGGARVEHRARHRQLAGGPGAQLGGEQAAGQRERGEFDGRVGGIPDDSGRTLPAALAPRPLLGGEPLAPAAEQRAGVRRDPLRTTAHQVEHPEPVAAIGAGRRAQEDDPLAVRRHGEGAGRTEREALGPC